jgi:hypothetical protein
MEQSEEKNPPTVEIVYADYLVDLVGFGVLVCPRCRPGSVGVGGGSVGGGSVGGGSVGDSGVGTTSVGVATGDPFSSVGWAKVTITVGVGVVVGIAEDVLTGVDVGGSKSITSAVGAGGLRMSRISS